MINSIQRVASKMGGSAVEYKKILKEATSNENWNIANSKLQVLADHTYNWEDYVVISKHLWKTVNSKPKEWRRIFKALNCMDYLVKNGAPRVVQDLKDDMYKIRGLQDFSYQENGVDRGQGVRDKSRELCELLQDPNMLQQEREFARQTREKLSGMTDAGHSVSSMSGGPDGMNPVGGGLMKGSAAPASGKYGGFGSEDIARLGYNQEGQFSNVYDPYTKSQAAPSQATHQANNTSKPTSTKENKSKKSKKKNKKKKKRDDDSSEDSDSSDASSDDSDSSSDSSVEKEKKSKKEAKRRSKQSKDDTKAVEDKKGVNLKEVPKSARSIGGVTIQGSNVQFTEAKPQQTLEVTATQQQPQTQAAQPSQQQLLMDLLDAPSQTQQATQQQQQQPQMQQQPSGFGFMQNSQPQAQTANMFGGMNMGQSTQATQQQQVPQQSMFQNMQMGSQQQSQQSQPQMQQQQPVMQQQPISNTSGFGFMNTANNLQAQQQPIGQPQQQQQPQQQNAFGFMNTQQQQPFGQPQTQQQQPVQQFGQQQTTQPQQQPMQNFNQQPQTQQMTNLFGGLNLNSNANAPTQSTMQAQQQPTSQAQPEMFGSFQSAGPTHEVKTESKDNYGGLFDFDSLKQEQLNVAKKHELQKQTSFEQSQGLLMTKPDDDFDSFFNKPAQQQQNMMQSNSMTGFGASGSMPTQGGQGLQQRPQMNQGFIPNNPGMQSRHFNSGMQNFGGMNMSQGHQPNPMGMGMGMQQQNSFGAPMGGVNQMPMMGNQQQQQQFPQQQQQQFPQQQQQSNFGFMR